MTTGNEPVLGLLAAEWAAIGDLAATLSDDDWERPSDLPGWTAKDCLSHMVGTELSLLGEPAPDVAVDHLPHVTSPFAVMLEVWVEARRGVPGSEVVAEFGDATRRRLDVLGAMGEDDWSRVGWSPVGEVPYRTFMEVRVFDCWMHEQDIRRAVGHPGGLDTDPAALSLGRIGDGLGFVVGKRAGAPEGTTVVVEVTGPRARTWSLEVTDRARLVDTVPSDPTVRLRTDLETLCALGGGRWDRPRAADRVEITGDTELAGRILDGMAITP